FFIFGTSGCIYIYTSVYIQHLILFHFFFYLIKFFVVAVSWCVPQPYKIESKHSRFSKGHESVSQITPSLLIINAPTYTKRKYLYNDGYINHLIFFVSS